MKLTRGLPLLALLFITLVFARAQTTEAARLAAPSAPTTSFPEWPVRAEGLTPSPRVTWGRLDNGLRYALLPNNTPADLISLYSQFYWNSVSPHVQTAIRYLNVTSSGRQWIANLYSNVFRAERYFDL